LAGAHGPRAPWSKGTSIVGHAQPGHNEWAAPATSWLGGLKSEVQHPAMLNRSMDCGLSHFSGPLDKVPEGLNGAAPVQRLARPVVQKVGNRVERHLVVDGQVRALRKYSAQQGVGVLASAPLPRAVRVAEVPAHVGGICQVTMSNHLPALVVGERLAHRLSDLVELEGEGRQGRLGSGSGILASSTKRVVRSTKTPMADLLAAPLIRSPSQ
jgi:hypothetical protein